MPSSSTSLVLSIANWVITSMKPKRTKPLLLALCKSLGVRSQESEVVGAHFTQISAFPPINPINPPVQESGIRIILCNGNTQNLFLVVPPAGGASPYLTTLYSVN